MAHPVVSACWFVALSVGLSGCNDSSANSTGACSLAVCALPDGGSDGEQAVRAGDGGTAAEAGTSDASTRGGSSGLLQDAEELSREVGGELLVLDARTASEYATAHVPSAVGLDVARLRAEVNGVGGQVAPVSEVAEQLGEVGVSLDVPVVVYGELSDLNAARMLWTLEYMGHHDVRMLNGGLAQYREEGFELSTQPVAPARSEFPTDRVESDVRVDVDWMLAHLDDPAVVLLDARSRDEYDAGHIPGALHFDWRDNIEQGRLKSNDELHAMYEDIAPDATVVAYCQSGFRASMTYVVMRHLGYPDVRLYDGSMAEWVQDPSRPLE